MEQRKKTIRIGFTEALPLAIAIAAYGFSYGVLANQANFSFISAVAMSLLVFSGSVQMVTIAMVSTGAGLASILFTTFLLNLRNLLYGAALAKGIAPAGKWRWLLSFGVTDEPFVLGSLRFKKHGPDPLYFGIVVATFYVAWFLSTLTGALIGGQVDPVKWGLDLAFPITFVALLIPLVVSRPAIATALTAAVVVLGMEYLAPGNDFTIITAGIFSPFVGLYLKRRADQENG